MNFAVLTLPRIKPGLNSLVAFSLQLSIYISLVLRNKIFGITNYVSFYSHTITCMIIALCCDYRSFLLVLPKQYIFCLVFP